MKDDRLWDEYYVKNGVHAINIEKVRDMLRKHDLTDPALTILDFGCGDGYFLKSMSDIFPMQFGCDISSKAVIRAKSHNPSATIRQNVRELPFRDNQFDIVFMIKSISAVAPAMLDLVLGEVKRILKRGGSILIVDFKPNERDALYPICGGMFRARRPEWSDEVFPLFTPEDFEKILGFDLLDSEELTLTSYHGNEYPGIMALLHDSTHEPQ